MAPPNFSAKNRNTFIEKMSSEEFDMLIIGGGITGAGIALDAASRGLKVALVEMQDFAGGTSGRSTKLIHGGLRYLKQFDFRLVAEVGKEREIIHRIAPHLTQPEPMLLPIVKGGSLGKFSTRIAMWIYEWIAGVKKEEWHKVLNKEETERAEPLLEKKNLLGGILFYEYRTDDARLTIEVIKEAAAQGALAVNYMKAVSFHYENKKISGALVEDQFTKRQYTIKSKYVVNACGPWVDDTCARASTSSVDSAEANAPEEKKLSITKGVHIVVDHKKLPVKQAVYFDALDKRMIFIIPREGKTYIGTTDTFYNGDLIDPQITQNDIDYLLRCCNAYFPDNQLLQNDIESGWAGLRPLIRKPGKDPSEISRKDELFESASGMIIIAGGKLTGYRKMAQRVVDIVVKKSGLHKQCITDSIKLSGGKFDSYQEFHRFIKNTKTKGSGLGLSFEETEFLTYRFGSNVQQVFDLIEFLNKTEQHSLPVLLRAQIRYCIDHEMCFTADDFLMRRTSLKLFNHVYATEKESEIRSYIDHVMKNDRP